MSKKSKKIVGNKTVKTPVSTDKPVIAPKTAAVKTEKSADAKTPKTPKIRMGKYGAPAIRANRGKRTASEFGDRHWVFRCVSAYDKKTLVATDFIDAEPKKHGVAGMDKNLAERILAATLAARPDAVNASCRYAGKTADGNETLYLPWIAFADANGDHRQKTA